MSKPCPGWTDLEQKLHECSEGRVDQALISDTSPTCRRCSRRKTKFDEEHGLRERREAEELARYKTEIDTYVADARRDITPNTNLFGYLTIVEELHNRHPWRATYKLSFRDAINVLRVLADLPILPYDHRRS